jgi:hypothetical protein
VGAVEVVRDWLLRTDGKTLIAQPHLDDENMWTIDDVASMDFHVQSPNITVAEKMGCERLLGRSVAERPHRRRAEGRAPWSNRAANAKARR